MDWTTEEAAAKQWREFELQRLFEGNRTARSVGIRARGHRHEHLAAGGAEMLSPWQTAEAITAEYLGHLSPETRNALVGSIATAIQAASNEQLARNRAGHLADVRDFMEKFGVPIAPRPAFPDQATLDLRARLIAEEFCEFLTACGYDWELDFGRYAGDKYERVGGGHQQADANFPKAVDGLLDLEYVTLGAHLAFGVDPAVPWRRVHLANMSKVGGAMRADGKIMKPEGFVPPDIEGALLDQGAEIGSIRPRGGEDEGGVMETNTARDCQQCRFCFCECGEDIVCGHPESFRETIFGRGVNYSRRAGSFCGPDGKLFEQRKTI